MKSVSVRLGLWAERIFAAFLFAMGGVLAVYGWDYGLGEMNDIGPGAFPLGLGLVLMALALRCAYEATPEDSAERDLSALLFMVPGIVLWALLIDWAGLVAATAVLVLFCIPAEAKLRPLGALVLAVLLCLAGWLVFIEGFNLPLTLFGAR
ncbi:tripartite tricarboxylate transporter TctB family protein [Jiella sonneratiae]|uniref:Tripartite tricarboxylate transporter TctB family protein n=1 Tax=Jiella sonneratiae TaxID=2816856 RepID=A0ABS3J266_9HYPH|nr:tripartite tricarboxylate transporter TctB family protein [Jiella sonneratiae]MBO0903763.1 tripartite tricarboxylate transporter TctB family protein [Jiella sonneratiae]